jgi:hypothetical protein
MAASAGGNRSGLDYRVLLTWPISAAQRKFPDSRANHAEPLKPICTDS